MGLDSLADPQSDPLKIDENSADTWHFRSQCTVEPGFLVNHEDSSDHQDHSSQEIPIQQPVSRNGKFRFMNTLFTLIINSKILI